MALKGYHSYRGRPGALRRLLVIVLLLVLIAACAFLFLQRYITYSDDGSFYLDLPFEINWEIPFLNHEDDPGNTDDEQEQDVNLIVDRPQEEQTGEKEPGDDQQGSADEQGTSGEQETVEDQPKDEPYTTRRLIELSQLPQDETALLAELTAAGTDGFVFCAKNDAGKVSFSSAKAIEKAIEENAVSRELVGRLCAQAGVYTVARINCFHDSVYAFANMKDAGVCQSNGYIWYDYNLQHWLDPEKAAARQYVIDLAVECAQLGFDELLLEDMCYPVGGKLYKIDYSKNTMAKVDALVLFLEELKNALEPYGVQLSLLLDEDVIRGVSEDTEHTGLIAQKILPLVDAVYAATADAETARQEMKILLGGENVPVLVPVVSEPAEEDGWYLVS